MSAYLSSASSVCFLRSPPLSVPKPKGIGLSCLHVGVMVHREKWSGYGCNNAVAVVSHEQYLSSEHGSANIAQ